MKREELLVNELGNGDGGHSRPRGSPMMLVGAALANGVSLTPAIHSVFGLFLLELSAAFGWSRAAISAVLGIVAVAGALVYPITGAYSDRHNIRPVLIIGNLVAGTAFVGLALLPPDIRVFYGVFTILAVSIAIPNSAVLTKLVLEAYRHRVATASALTAGVGNGIGAAVMPIVIAFAIARVGWRAAYAVEGAIVAAVGVTGLLLMSLIGRQDATGPAMPATSGASAVTFSTCLRGRAFWLVLVPISMGAGASVTIFSHIAPILAEKQISMQTAALVISAVAVTSSISQIVMGACFDRWQTPLIIPPLYLLAAGEILLFRSVTATPSLILLGIGFGFSAGTLFSAIPFLVARYFPPELTGRMIGLMYSAIVVAQGVTPVLFDHAFDVQHSYRGALHVSALLCVLGTFASLTLPRVKRAPAAGALSAGVALH